MEEQPKVEEKAEKAEGEQDAQDKPAEEDSQPAAPAPTPVQLYSYVGDPSYPYELDARNLDGPVTLATSAELKEQVESFASMSIEMWIAARKEDLERIRAEGRIELLQQNGGMGLKLEEGKLCHYRWGGPEEKAELQSLDADGWTRIVVVNEGDKAHVYENGSLLATVASGGCQEPHADNPLTLMAEFGQSGSNSTKAFPGYFGWVRMWNR